MVSLDHTYCALFDSAYLPKALVLYRSLVHHRPDAELVAYCFDDASVDTLRRLGLPRVHPISLSELEADDPDLAAVRQDRTTVEYFWTATPAVVVNLMSRRPDLDRVTYVDADLRFFCDPQILFDEMADQSVLITPHRYPPIYAQHEVHGLFNVQFMSFRLDDRGHAVAAWWRERCLEWCYDRIEPTRFADQKYLDEWPQRFDGVHVLEHPGGGLAPWNAFGHDVRVTDGIGSVDGEPLVFFHFHGLRLLENGRARLWPAGFHVPRAVRRDVYGPYLRELAQARRDIVAVAPDYDDDLVAPPTVSVRWAQLRSRIGEAATRRLWSVRHQEPAAS